MQKLTNSLKIFKTHFEVVLHLYMVVYEFIRPRFSPEKNLYLTVEPTKYSGHKGKT